MEQPMKTVDQCQTDPARSLAFNEVLLGVSAPIWSGINTGLNAVSFELIVLKL